VCRMPRRPIISTTSPPRQRTCRVGFRQFNAAMASAESIGGSGLEERMARAKAYVAYAQAHPGMYGLMFRTERCRYDPAVAA